MSEYPYKVNKNFCATVGEVAKLHMYCCVCKTKVKHHWTYCPRCGESTESAIYGEKVNLHDGDDESEKM